MAGLEFYTFSIRELICGTPRDWLSLIKNHVAFSATSMFICAPLALALFATGILPWRYASWFMALLFVENIAQELNRILVATAHPIRASAALFLRSGLWCMALVPIFHWIPSTRSLDHVLAAWLIGSASASLLGASTLLRFDRASLSKPIDWRWIRRGLAVAAPLLAASLAMRGVFTMDRYLIEHIAGLATVGAYVLFIGMATAVLSFLDAGVVDFTYPRLVTAARETDRRHFDSEMIRLAWQIVLGSAVLCLVIAALARPLIVWLDRPIYLDHLPMLRWTLAAIFINALALLPHMGLYAHGQDKPLLHSQVACAATFVAYSLAAGPSRGAIAVPEALCLSMVIMLIWKTISFNSMLKTRPRAAPYSDRT